MGDCRGRVARRPRRANGFGYDPAFLPDATGGDRTMAELSDAEKDAISHRGRAVRALQMVPGLSAGGVLADPPGHDGWRRWRGASAGTGTAARLVRLPFWCTTRQISLPHPPAGST